MLWLVWRHNKDFVHPVAIFVILLILYLVCDTVDNNVVVVNHTRFATFIAFNNKVGRLQEFTSWAGPPRPTSQKPLDAVWQPVAHTKRPFYVYSAFLDLRRPTPAVVVIGVTRRTRIKPTILCRLWMRSSHATYILEAVVKYTKEYDNWCNNTAFVLCRLNRLYPKDTVGGSISVVSQDASEQLATNLLQVIDTKPGNSSKLNLHKCVRAIHNSFDDVEVMVEWIELNRMLGVSHFYFYNMSIGPHVDCLLKKYQKSEELFTILPFKSPVHNFWNEGQIASSQDCLYRSMSRANWLMLTDLDEVVLPHRAGLRGLEQSKDDLPFYLSLFNSVVREYSMKDKQFALYFRNAFFYQGFEDDPLSPVPLLTSRKTKRLQFLNWYGVRSKYAVQPSQAVELGIYKVTEFLADSTSMDVRVGSDVAMLHHYRRECVQFMCTEGFPTKVDRSAHVWSKPLWKRVRQKLKT